MNAEYYFDQLIGVSEKLIDILSVESNLIREREIENLHNLQEEKTRLSFEYEKQVSVLGEQPELIDYANPTQKERLKSLAIDFEEAAKENLKVLKAAHESGNRVLIAIKNAALEMQSNGKGYTQNGASTNTAQTSQNVSVSINEKL